MTTNTINICADCGFIDETVQFDEDNNCFMCLACLYELELFDWADEIMEEYGWLIPNDGEKGSSDDKAHI